MMGMRKYYLTSTSFSLKFKILEILLIISTKSVILIPSQKEADFSQKELGRIVTKVSKTA